MKILITGGAGYVGNELTYELLKNPSIEKIFIYDNLSRKNYNLFLDTKYKSGKVKFVQGELLDSRKLRSVLDGVDIVFHLAARVSTPFASEDSHLFEQTNNWGTAELVYAAETSHVKKFIYTSSTSVYGSSEEMIDISTNPNPKTFYGSSKLRSEAHVERLFDKMSTYILRTGNIYGYSPSVRFDAVINRFLFEANFTGRIQITGNGQQKRSFIHIDRVVNVLSNLLNKPCLPAGRELPSGTYNLVNKNLSIIEIADVVKELYPDLDMIFVNQHLMMREMKVKPDERLTAVCTYKERSFKEELISFKEKFAFSSFE
jgi:UDP-glucose 4-epimerase